MTVRPIVKWPDPCLSQLAEPVTDPQEIGDLVRDMFETMYAEPGRGLAAPQIGVLLRVFVMDAGWRTGDMTPLACINPRIVSASATRAAAVEGCLSLPGVSAEVTRAADIVLGYTDLNGAACEVALTGFASACAQHEIDHLNGIVYLDHLSDDIRKSVVAAFEAAA